MTDSAIDQLINLAPHSENLVDWIVKEVAGRALDRSNGEIKDAATLLNLPFSELKKILSS